MIVEKNYRFSFLKIKTSGLFKKCFVLASFVLSSFVLASFVLVSFVLASFVLASFVLASLVLASLVLASFVLVSFVTYRGNFLFSTDLLKHLIIVLIFRERGGTCSTCTALGN